MAALRLLTKDQLLRCCKKSKSSRIGIRVGLGFFLRLAFEPFSTACQIEVCNQSEGCQMAALFGVC
jgi:hypothetical protein